MDIETYRRAGELIDDMPIGAGLNRNLASSPSAPGEAVEAELTNMIERRHDARVVEEGHRPTEEMWAESERCHNARRRSEIDVARYEYHQGQAVRLAATLGDLVSYHEREAQKYLPKGAA